MLKSIHIKNFRLFRDLKIEPLNRVNLIAGENNSGKTALLEALYLLLGDDKSFEHFASAFRSNQVPDDFESFWVWLSYQRKLKEPVEIVAVDDEDTPYLVKQQEQTLRDDTTVLNFDYFKYGNHQFYQSVSKDRGFDSRNLSRSAWPEVLLFSVDPSSPTEDADYFNRIAIKRGEEEKLIKLLYVIEPHLQDLKYAKLGSQPGSKPLVYADVGMEDLIPTTQLGQGFTRLLRLYSEILVAKSKIILIDEIENGIHYKAMPKVWKGIATIAREEDLQVFATTHSYECIRSAHQAFSSETQYDLALHRLERTGDDVKAVTYDKTTLETSIEMNLEVR